MMEPSQTAEEDGEETIPSPILTIAEADGGLPLSQSLETPGMIHSQSRLWRGRNLSPEPAIPAAAAENNVGMALAPI
jgi:hypothetical protein